MYLSKWPLRIVTGKLTKNKILRVLWMFKKKMDETTTDISFKTWKSNYIENWHFIYVTSHNNKKRKINKCQKLTLTRALLDNFNKLRWQYNVTWRELQRVKVQCWISGKLRKCWRLIPFLSIKRITNDNLHTKHIE